jgi:deoxycytidylate deaminase
MDSNWTDVLPEDPANWWVDRMYLQDAFAAARHSTDPNTQVGAVLVVPAGGVVLAAWNSVPERLCNYPYTPDTKNFCTEHAERSVLFKAIKNGLPTDGLHLYSTWSACAECSRAIIEFGITRFVTFRRLVEATPTKWESSMQSGIQMMRDSGVSVVGWAGDIGSTASIRFGGRTVCAEELR